MEKTTELPEPARPTPACVMSIDLYGTSVDLEADAMIWIQSDGNYIKIRTANATYYKRATLSEAADLLEPQGFMRIHRSILVNGSHITEVVYRGNNEYEIATSEGSRLRSGRTYKSRIQAYQQSPHRTKL